MSPRLLRHVVAHAAAVEPAAVLREFFDGQDSFWFDDANGWSVIGTGTRWTAVGAVLPALAEVEAGWRADPLVPADGDYDGEGDSPPFVPGLVGWLGYGLARETLGETGAPASSHPDSAFLRVDRAIAIGPGSDGRRRVELLAVGEGWARAGLGEWRDRTEGRLQDLAAASGIDRITPGEAPPVAAPEVQWHDDRDRYLQLVRACQRAIARGDAYVLNLSTEITVHPAPGDHPFDALTVAERLRALSPSPHGGLLRIGDVTLVSSSPERFVRIADGVVTTYPVKGTRPRSTDAHADAALRDELAQNAKERAENVMIVDLMRNDLARVSEPGDVEVVSLLHVETHPQVHQLVSAVAARLRPGFGVAEVLAAAFPAGSMTGAPKRSAVTILAGLEQRARGLYSGTFGWIGRDGSADLAMVIRSIVIDDDGATIGVGGGVTALSVPEEEHDEVLLKARAMLRALGVAGDVADGQGGAPADG